MRYDFAPMEGITDSVFRRVHHEIFGGVDRYWAPFWSPSKDHILTARVRRDIAPENNRSIPMIPQLMTRSASDFVWAAEVLRDMGYSEVNLNLGCPSGTVTAKGKGCGALTDLRTLEDLLDGILRDCPLPVSVKTRMGVTDPKELEALLSLYRQYPLKELVIHARVRKDMYREPVRQEGFREALLDSPFPVICNGDIKTLEDCCAMEEKYPEAAGLMIGRGLVADPALIRKRKGGAPATKEELLSFNSGLFEGYVEAFGCLHNAARRMKEHWRYLILLFDDRNAMRKLLQKEADPGYFRTLTEMAINELPLRDSAEVDW